MATKLPEEQSLSREDLAALQKRRFAGMFAEITQRNAFYRAKLSGWTADRAVREFSAMPLTTREELEQDQLAHPPYGTNLTYPLDQYCRYHQTSGSSGRPLRTLNRAEDWRWWIECWKTIYAAAGVGPDDRLIFPFSFGPFIGFWAAFESAVAMGNLSLPAGGMTTIARIEFLLANEATFVCCTPTYALHMAEIAAEREIDLAASKVRGLIVAGEPGGNIPATRARIEQAWGARVFDHAGMTEIGPYGFECVESPGSMHVNEAQFIEEVIDPKTLQPVEAGQRGELVLTNLGRWGSPLIRYRTGDEVLVLRDRCACGRTFARLEGGLLGRIDDMFIIRGNNVHPAAVEGILREFPAVVEYRLTIEQRGALSELRIEIEPARGTQHDELSKKVAESIASRLSFRPVVQCVEPGALPRFEMKARRVIRGRN
jgi:phenylacetate-CoA ligase